MSSHLSPQIEAQMAELLKKLPLIPCRPPGAHNQSAGDCPGCRAAHGEITFAFPKEEKPMTPSPVPSGHTPICCDTCPMTPTCEDAAAFRCDIGLHDWINRGHDGDLWRECFLCGEQEDR